MAGPDTEPKRGIGDQIETIIGEHKVVLTAVAVLFGFQLSLAFSSGFERTPAWARAASFAALLCTAVAIVFLLAPTSYHRFTRGLEETYAYLHLAQRNVGAAFAFIAASVALSVLVAAQQAFGWNVLSIASSAGIAFVMALAWWVFPFLRARRRGAYGRKWLPHEDPDESEGAPRRRDGRRAS